MAARNARSLPGRRGRAGRRRRVAGVTLLEVLVSVGILAIIGTLIYGAFDGMSRSRAGISRMSDRYHQGRAAIARISREIQEAFLSRHQPLDKNIVVRLTAFVGDDASPADRLDFTAFAHRRLLRNAHESDQCEIGYFGSRDPESDKLDLVRRESKTIDTEPTRGGVVNVLAEDIESFNVEYLDPLTSEWTDTWDSTQPAAQFERLPTQVRVTLVLKGGPGGEPIRFETKVPIAMQVPLAFDASTSTSTSN
ncbi:type II secretion system protein GspJ [Sorangium sp. So ce131]|uniref:type II secretion system protein GspJ n=1 Tax=Sorangium sp. So ce131 TaxID=3133282 RepID=UPI003F60CA6F